MEDSFARVSLATERGPRRVESPQGHLGQDTVPAKKRACPSPLGEGKRDHVRLAGFRAGLLGLGERLWDPDVAGEGGGGRGGGAGGAGWGRPVHN